MSVCCVWFQFSRARCPTRTQLQRCDVTVRSLSLCPALKLYLGVAVPTYTGHTGTCLLLATEELPHSYLSNISDRFLPPLTSTSHSYILKGIAHPVKHKMQPLCKQYSCIFMSEMAYQLPIDIAICILISVDFTGKVEFTLLCITHVALVCHVQPIILQ